MGSDEVQGLTVRVRDGQTLGVVVGVFAKGPLAGRLRVQWPTPAVATEQDRSTVAPFTPSHARRWCVSGTRAWSWARP
jgi:hypothetical protein